MSTINAQDIIDQCKVDLKDASATTWTEATLLGYLNAAQRAVVINKPDAYIVTNPVQLVAGTKQRAPTNAHKVVDLVRNLGTTGTVAGRSIIEADMLTLDLANRNWHAAAASTVVENYAKSDDPKVVYVSPPQPTGTKGYVEMVYSVAPPDIVIGADILLEDIYANAIQYYMMARAHMKEDVKADPALAVGYMAQFRTELGLSEEA